MNINPKALWTRIHKFSPNFDGFFNNKQKKKTQKTIKDIDDFEPCMSDLSSTSDEEHDNSKLFTIFITADQWKCMQRDDGISNKLKSGI